MNFLSINVKGLGATRKQDWIKRLKVKNDVSFIAIQETQMVNADSVNIDSLWGGKGFDCDKVDANGRSGGLINIWDEKVFDRRVTISNQNFLFSSGTLVSDNSPINIVNVYGPQNVVLKRRLWD